MKHSVSVEKFKKQLSYGSSTPKTKLILGNAIFREILQHMLIKIYISVVCHILQGKMLHALNDYFLYRKCPNAIYSTYYDIVFIIIQYVSKSVDNGNCLINLISIYS